MSTKNFLGGVLLAFVAVCAFALFQRSNTFGNVDYDERRFNADVYQNDVKMLSGGEFVGPIDTEQTVELDALTTLNSGLLMSNSTATTSKGTVTYTAANITSIHSLIHTTTGATTATLPASSTLSSLIPTAGDRMSIVVVNPGTGILTLAGGTGTTLVSASTSKAIHDGGTGLLEFVRKADTDISVFMSTGI